MRQALPLIVALIVPLAPVAAQDSQPTRAPGPPTQGEGFIPPRPAAGAERTDERYEMVLRQIAEPPAGRTRVTDERVLDAMRAVPRHVFVPGTNSRYAYRDRPLSIGEGQTISQPYIVAVMVSALELRRTDRVLELGTGSGYQAAVLAELASVVISVERLTSLAESARRRLEELGYSNVTIGPAAPEELGWPRAAPYDAIVVAAGAPRLARELIDQLVVGGRHPGDARGVGARGR